MTRLRDTLSKLRRDRKKALVVYLTAGDPSLEVAVDAALAAVRGGADVLEIGVPFSDPVADGPVIQRAMGRALGGGGGFGPALEVVRAVRAHAEVPVVLFGYLNPLLWLGLPESCRAAAEAGVDGLLVVDLPPEEADEARAAAAEAELDWVSLVAPTTGKTRAAAIATNATGFVYLVSMTGVTGGALSDPARLAPIVGELRAVSSIPVCIGFGIRDAASAQSAASVADGVVVGSAVVAALEQGGAAAVETLVRELRRGADRSAS